MSTEESTPDTQTETTTRARLEISIAPGVIFPDWSVVASDTVEQALGDIFQAFGVERRWRDLGVDEDCIRRAVMDEYGRTGVPPKRCRGLDHVGPR